MGNTVGQRVVDGGNVVKETINNVVNKTSYTSSKGLHKWD